MKRLGVCGVGGGMNGRDAAMLAAQRALDQLGALRPVFALVFAAQEFRMDDVQAGLGSLLGDTPLWGFSTLSPLDGSGDQPGSVVVALLAGADRHAGVKWFPAGAQDGAGTARRLAQALHQEVFFPPFLLIAADGFDSSLAHACSALGGLEIGVAGCMASGSLSAACTSQLAGNQFGPGGLAAASLGGRFRVGVGFAQGWRDVGVYFRATRARGTWLHELDGAPAVDTYARLFGTSARDWAFPPLNEMARLYPLRVEQGTYGAAQAGAPGPLICSILQVGLDGSLHMSAPVPEGAVVHLMSGDPVACLEGARAAVRQALGSLEEGARPLLALAFVDAAWRILFEARPTAIAEALSSVLEMQHGRLPLAGAYTFGQLVRPVLDRPPALHNQGLALVVIGEASE